MGNIAVVDLGSNTIKVAVIKLATPLRALFRSTKQVRISRGMHKGDSLKLSEEAMKAAVGAVEELIAEASAYNLETTCIVGTSALRDATNANDFASMLENKTGVKLRILSGTEEAEYAARGALSDPVLTDIETDLSIVDLGGGSLECINFQHNKLKQAISLPLGAVRLTERFISNPESAIDYSEIEKVFEYAKSELINSDFNFNEVKLPLIGLGGAFIALRSMIAARQNLEESKPAQAFLNCADFGEILKDITAQSLEERVKIPGLPAKRADILPAAIAVMLAVADLADCKQFLHTYYNLPFGIADELRETAKAS